MNKTKTSQNGNALPLVLGIVLILAIGIGGWFYLSKTPESAASKTVEAALEQDGASPDEAPPLASTEQTVPVDQAEPLDPATETTADESSSADTSTTSAPATIDLDKAMAPRTAGDPNAPIKIIEYASLTCSHCAHFHNDIYPELKAKYIDTGKVFFEFREFPLNDPALKGTLTARCLPAEKYDSFVSLLFKTQEHWAGGLDYTAALKQNAKLAGMSDETFEACQSNSGLKLAVADAMQKAQDQWKISATPTFIINDGAETISGAVPLAEFERVFRKVSGDAVGAVPAVE